MNDGHLMPFPGATINQRRYFDSSFYFILFSGSETERFVNEIGCSVPISKLPNVDLQKSSNKISISDCKLHLLAEVG